MVYTLFFMSLAVSFQEKRDHTQFAQQGEIHVTDQYPNQTLQSPGLPQWPVHHRYRQ